MADAEVKGIAEKYGICLKQHQLDALVCLLERKGDLLVNLPVGFGKSMIYTLLPDVLANGKEHPIVLVVSPLNIIQRDQLEALRTIGISGCKLNHKGKVDGCTDNGGPVDLISLKQGIYKVILCHPESLLQTPEGKDLLVDERMKENVVAIVIDECHVAEKWGADFRSTFRQLGSLRAFFPDVPMVALSGTLTTQQKETIPKVLGMKQLHIVEQSPDRVNIFFEKRRKDTGDDVLEQYEQILHPLCDELFQKRQSFPITLVFIPVFYMSEALMYLQSLFGISTIEQACYSAICSGQDEHVIRYTISELKKESSRIRLVLTTSIAGMGFDPENVTRVIHTCPPRSLSQYLQEVGRAGRRGQPANAILYYRNSEIAKNLPGIQDDIILYCLQDSSCLRNQLLSVFGFEKDPTISNSRCCSFCSSQS